MNIEPFFDRDTHTLTYVVWSEPSKHAVVIDPVMDYDPVGSKVSFDSVDRVSEFLRSHELDLKMILETHAHADHLSGSQELRRRFPGAVVAIGARITEVQALFKDVFDLPGDFPTDGRQFDRLLQADEEVQLDGLSFRVLPTPGHTPACVSYLFGDVLFTGDAIFMPDMGTGRCDFPGGSAADLYDSIHDTIYALPESTRVFVGHDYCPGKRELAWVSTVGEQKRANVQLPYGRSKEEFVRFRSQRDRTLDPPKLLFQSVQVNVDAGALPQPARGERRYLKIPINVFRPEPTAVSLEDANGSSSRD